MIHIVPDINVNNFQIPATLVINAISADDVASLIKEHGHMAYSWAIDIVEWVGKTLGIQMKFTFDKPFFKPGDMVIAYDIEYGLCFHLITIIKGAQL